MPHWEGFCEITQLLITNAFQDGAECLDFNLYMNLKTHYCFVLVYSVPNNYAFLRVYLYSGGNNNLPLTDFVSLFNDTEMKSLTTVSF